MRQAVYMQLADQLRDRILKDEFRYGQLFPPERELEKMYGIDRKTIRKSLGILVEEGLLVRIQGKGTYVRRPDIRFPMKAAEGFSRLLYQQGIQTSSNVITKTREPVGYRLAKKMELPEAETVWKLIRLRLAEGEPVALEYTYVREGRIPNFAEIDFSVCSLYDAWIKNGTVPSHIQETIDAVELSGTEAKYLCKPQGSLAFLVTDITRDQNGIVIEYNRAYTNSDRIHLSAQLS